MSVSIARLTKYALRIAEEAGKIIREIALGEDLEICDKSLDSFPDLQTAADRRSEALIVTALTEVFPGLRIIGEEGVAPGSPDWEAARIRVLADLLNLEIGTIPEIDIGRVTVWIDPLDGTSDFVKKEFHCVTTLIGVSVDSEAVAGVILRPFNGEALWGVQGLGVFHSSGTRLLGSPRVDSLRQLRAVTTGSRSTPVIDAALERLQPASVRRVGGAGFKYWLLLTGEADVYFYPRPGMKLWDVCPGDAMLNMLGGRSTDSQGNAIVYSQATVTLGGGVIATSPGAAHLHSKILLA